MKRYQVHFTPRVMMDERMVTAFCDDLGLVASGDTRAEAVTGLLETVAAYGRALYRSGILDAVLKASGVDSDSWIAREMDIFTAEFLVG